jgi:ribonuclease HI
MFVEIYADGAYRMKYKAGGWGVLLRWRGHERELFGGERDTTNNRMELTAAIEGLRALKRPMSVRLHSDSQYVIKGMNDWRHNWVLNNWYSHATGMPVKNDDLWKTLIVEAERHTVEWIWVRGHDGHVDNERADALANKGADSAMLPQSIV